ncbi:MAG: hypothetical protein ACYTFA_13810 [Planctomycetota bacterium]
MTRLERLQFGRMARALRNCCAVVVGAVATHLASSPAWAQKPGRVPGDGAGFYPWAIAAGIIVVICVAGFLNPKRSHLG